MTALSPPPVAAAETCWPTIPFGFTTFVTSFPGPYPSTPPIPPARVSVASCLPSIPPVASCEPAEITNSSVDSITISLPRSSATVRTVVRPWADAVVLAAASSMRFMTPAASLRAKIPASTAPPPVNASANDAALMIISMRVAQRCCSMSWAYWSQNFCISRQDVTSPPMPPLYDLITAW